VPVLAAEVPTRGNGGLSADGRFVTYKLKRNVRWVDGRAFTADDVVFTYEFASNKDVGAFTYALYENVEKAEAIDPRTIKFTFKRPTPAWYLTNVPILPRHAFDGYSGANARNAPFNLKPFGTGPYKVESFLPGDLVIYSINEFYREPDKPAFHQVLLKGGGDAVSAGRAVFETGEYDYAWDLQVEWPVLEQMMRGPKGVLVTGDGPGVEMIHCNQTDPNKEVDGQRSSLKAPHPFLTDLSVRQALGLAIDREGIARHLYGQTGVATANVLTMPSRVNSRNTRVVFDVAKANRLLDEAGWQRGPDGVRQKGGIKLRVTFATSVNTLRQKEQEIIKAGWAQIGIDTLLKPIDPGVYFGTSPGNTDNQIHFYRDVEMYTEGSASFPSYIMSRWYSGNPAKDIPQKENNWSGRNVCRWINEEYNELYNQGLVELDPKKNDALWIKMNDLVVTQAITLPIIHRKAVSARAKTLYVGENITPYSAETWNIADWRRIG
jgi:peptide/nickel transport system substrate-binding protein